ncbi:MAG: alpha/beta fold hydrolase [Actinomycetota bacterium]|nr:alpha/beta fold hydrolase [Actinomycetota bacterium]
MNRTPDVSGPSGLHALPAGAGHAVVCGGGIAGLLAARVLASHFEQVTLVERDALTDSAQARKGVPQGQVLHVLLARGLQIVERLFPGYGHQLQAAGAVWVRVPTDALILTPAGWLDRRARGFPLLSASRPLFEWAIRRRLRELPGVTVLDHHDVTSLLTSRDGRQVTGVTLRPLGHAGGSQQLAADLVVDAGGRGSRAPTWLSEAGYATPTKTHVDPNVAYAYRSYRIPDDFSADWQLVMLASQPPSIPRTGYLLPIEHRQWMVALMGAAGQHPPTDEDGFAAFARSLRHPIIADALAAAEPVTPIRGYRGTANRLWHYERMRRWPERFIAFGDAVCAFNPIYGQGMSTAAVAAETLDTCLREQRRQRPTDDLDGLARHFQQRLARRNADPWMLSTSEDLRYPTTTGMRVTTATRLQHRYLDQVVAATTQDPTTANTYIQVLGMLARPTSLFTPRILAAAARARPSGDGALPPSCPSHPPDPPPRASSERPRGDTARIPNAAERRAPVIEDAVTVDEVRSPYLHAGPTEAHEAVVFVHGNPGPAEDWRRLVAHTGAFTRAVAPDLPGFGGAGKPDRFDYTVDGYARHLGGILDQLSVYRAHLVLHDFGAPWGLTWAVSHPNRFASVTLINAGVLPGYRWHYVARIWRTPLLGEAFFRTATFPAFRLVLRHGNPRGLPLEVLKRMYRDCKNPEVQRAVLRLYRATDDVAASSMHLHDRLRALDRLALVVWGARDPYLPVRYAERQRETFPHAEVVVLHDSGHWPMIDHPVAVEQPVLRFLSALTSDPHANAPRGGG